MPVTKPQVVTSCSSKGELFPAPWIMASGVTSVGMACASALAGSSIDNDKYRYSTLHNRGIEALLNIRNYSSNLSTKLRGGAELPILHCTFPTRAGQNIYVQQQW